MPIVPAACVFDLVESGAVAARARRGLRGRAAAAGRPTPIGPGRRGHGRDGREVARPSSTRSPGGFGAAATRCDDAQVVAFAVVNAVGDVIGRRRIGARGLHRAARQHPDSRADAPFEERTGRATRRSSWSSPTRSATRPRAISLAQSAHDGFARALRPAHTRFDGDVAIALATGVVEAHLDRLRVAAADVVAEAIRSACR